MSEYAQALAALRRQKDAIDTAIKALEALSGGVPMVNGAAQRPRSTAPEVAAIQAAIRSGEKVSAIAKRFNRHVQSIYSARSRMLAREAQTQTAIT